VRHAACTEIRCEFARIAHPNDDTVVIADPFGESFGWSGESGVQIDRIRGEGAIRDTGLDGEFQTIRIAAQFDGRRRI
jgi:hypothetical protein